ncbi:ABC transporter permease [Spiroplasma endosymbiont of Megaselia nigra]|uniref:ABC transporter permease n=1 Tax=Spiroplasma endosymbiont of Megaselia nigra TaxID=2478537 RepID=UPI000F89831C|nr:ABC transporter permease [Spiroplasma endosymbiont of Megaselia nigra]RUO86650.1 ABC transporter permease [Spiroplasma endosymbiont of Megaselia nigra]
MRQILKSYLKSYFKNWIEAGGLILFIIIIIATIAGILSGALQYKIKYNDLVYTSEQWDYNFSVEDYKPNFMEDYYLHNKFIDKNKQEINVTGVPQAILNENSSWWKTIKSVCGTLASPELQQICSTSQIITKLAEVAQYRGMKQNIDSVNPIGYLYFKKFNWNQPKEMVTRLLRQKTLPEYSVGVFEAISFKQESGSNYTLKITPAVVQNLEQTAAFNFNQLKLYQGQLPTVDNEAVVSSLFAEQNHLKIGDIFPVIPNNPNFNLKIVGIGNNLDNFIKRTSLKINSSNDIRKYGVLFTTEHFQTQLQDANVRGELGNITLNPSQKILIKLNSTNAILTLKENLAPGYINPTATLIPYENSDIAMQTQNINIQIILYSAIGSVLLFLGFIFINYTMKKEMNKNRRQIGIFKAFGYQTTELSWIFSTKFFVTMLFGIILGYCVSIPIQLYVNTLYTTGLLIPFKLIYVSWWFMLILFLVIPIFFTTLSFLFTMSYLKKPSLVLINGAGKMHFYGLIIGIKKIFSKTSFLFRIQLAFTLKEFWKWMIVMFIFFISSLLFIIQFNASDIFRQIVYSFSNVYQKDVDHRFQFPSLLTMATSHRTPTGEEKLKLINNNHFRVLPTSNVEQTQAVSLAKFNELATAIHHNPMDMELWQKLFLYQPIYQSVYLTDLIQVVKDITNITGINLPDWGKNIVNLSNLIDQTHINTVVSFNTLYYNPQTELPVLNLAVTPSNRETAVISDFNLKGIESNTWTNFYQMEGVNKTVINELFAAPLTRTQIPAIISEKIAKLNNLKINDTFEFTVKNVISPYNISIVVKEINKNDTTRSNVFINANTIRFLFYDFNEKPVPNYFYDGVIYKEKMIYDKINPKELLMGKQDYKITLQNLTINIFNHDITDNLGKIMTTITSDGSDISIFMGPNNVELITLQKLLASAGLGMLNDSLLILQILNGIIIFIILAVITFSVIDEASSVILTMRALGYKPRQVNFIVIGNYVLGVLFTFFLAYVISLLIWYFAVNIILEQFKFVINLPLNWQTPLKVGTIISIILVLLWLLSMYLVKKQKLNELTE